LALVLSKENAMDEQWGEPGPGDRVRQYRREIAQILEVFGHPAAVVTEETRLSDFPLQEEPAMPTVMEVQIATGIRVRPQDRLIDIARRMRQLADRQIAAATPEARHAWVDWLGERDAATLLLSLIQAIDAGSSLASLKAMVDGWRRNALRALAAEDYRADVDEYLEVSVDARLYLLARPELMRHLEDAEGNEADDA
jgi:hypothetical protein